MINYRIFTKSDIYFNALKRQNKKLGNKGGIYVLGECTIGIMGIVIWIYNLK
jgi:hypothetical protein